MDADVQLKNEMDVLFQVTKSITMNDLLEDEEPINDEMLDTHQNFKKLGPPIKKAGWNNSSKHLKLNIIP